MIIPWDISALSNQSTMHGTQKARPRSGLVRENRCEQVHEPAFRCRRRTKFFGVVLNFCSFWELHSSTLTQRPLLQLLYIQEILLMRAGTGENLRSVRWIWSCITSAERLSSWCCALL
eukprot:SAG11_NODE_2290_length_3558_cov_2.262215_1_plen_118_part_00